MDAEIASSVSSNASNRFVPRATANRNVPANTVAITTAVSHTTPFNPHHASNFPTAMSYSHSQANQGCQRIKENESNRGIVWVARICWPFRMCQPMPASFSNLTESGVNTSAPSSARKIRSASEGMALRSHKGKEVARGTCSEELLEPSAIAVNLIDVGL